MAPRQTSSPEYSMLLLGFYMKVMMIKARRERIRRVEGEEVAVRERGTVTYMKISSACSCKSSTFFSTLYISFQIKIKYNIKDK